MSDTTTTFRPRRFVRTSERARALARFGWQASLAGEHASAVAALRLASLSLPEDWEVLAAFGVALARVRAFREARRVLQRAALRAPHDLAVWCNLAEVQLELNDFRGALTSLRVCARLDPAAATPSGVRSRVLAMRAAKSLNARA